LKSHAPRHQTITAAPAARFFRLIARHRKHAHEQDDKGRQSGDENENEENIRECHRRLHVDAPVDTQELVSRHFSDKPSGAQGDAVSHARERITPKAIRST
jgi:hypothetical protein